MDRKAIATGATVDEAIDAACAKLGVMREDVEIDVLERAGSKFFGLKKIPAKVEVTLNDEYAAKLEAEEKKAEQRKAKERKPEPKPQPKAEQKPVFAAEPKENKKFEKPKQKPQREPKKEVAPAAETPVLAEEPKEEAPVEVKELAPEVLEEKGGAAAAYIKEILTALGYPQAEVTYTQKDGMIVLQLSGDNMGVVVGKRGDNLDAMQYLASLIANRSEGSYVRVVLDVDDYRSKREASLRAYARKTAIQAVRNQRSITLEAMNPYERRIVHSTVQTVTGATSKSIGTEPNRRVVISPEGGGKHYNDHHGRDDRRGGHGRRPMHRDSQKVIVAPSNEPPKNDTSSISLYGRIDLD